MALPITIPLINPNEPEALLASINVGESEQVEPGDLICVLETTKSTAEVHAECGGFVVGISNAAGDTVLAGDILAYIADSPEWEPPVRKPPEERRTPGALTPDGVRITNPALALANKHNLDLSVLPPGLLITEAIVRDFIYETGDIPEGQLDAEFDPTAILIYGAGGHGKSVLDLLRAVDGFRLAGFIDDGVPVGKIVMGMKVLGNAEILPNLHKKGVHQAINAVGGVGNAGIRQKVFQKLIEAGFDFPTIVHPTAFVESSAVISNGVQVFPHAYIGSEVEVGFGTIVNTGAIISHECELGELVNVSPGAILAGGVKVGVGALIGMGVTVNLQVEIGKGARVGNGATVISDVPNGGVVPAGTTWPKK